MRKETFKNLCDKVRMEVQHNGLAKELYEGLPEDKEKLEKIIKILKTSPREKCLVQDSQYDRILSQAINLVKGA